MPKIARASRLIPEVARPLPFPVGSNSRKIQRPKAPKQLSAISRPVRRDTVALSDNSADPIEPLLEVKRAAHLLGISVKTLRDWMLYRRIDFVKVGAHVRIRPETIRTLVARNTRPAECPHEHLEASR